MEDIDPSILAQLSDEDLSALEANDLSKLSDKGLWLLGDNPIVNKPHPDFSSFMSPGQSTRMTAKTLADSPEEIKSYVEKTMPGYEAVIKGGEVGVRKIGEQDFVRLDPSGWQGVGEAARDVGESLYDLASGLGIGAMTVGGGISGGPLGAAGAGVAGGAGFSALKKAMARAAGVKDELTLGDLGDVGIDAALSGITPSITGSGASKTQIAKEGLRRAEAALAKSGLKEAAEVPLKQQVISDAAKKAARDRLIESETANVLKSQRGVFGRMAPNAMSKLTGISEETTSTAAKNFDKMAQILEQPAVHSKQAIQKASDAFNAEQKRLSALRDQALEEASAQGKTVKLDPVRKRFKAAISQAEKLEKETGLPVFGDELSKLKSDFSEYLGSPSEVVSPLVDDLGRPIVTKVEPIKEMGLADARKLQQRLTDLGKTGQMNLDGLVQSSQKNSYLKQVESLGRKSAEDIGNQIDEAVPGISDIKKRSSDLIKKKKELDQIGFKSPRATGKLFRNIQSGVRGEDRALLQDVDKELGTDLYQMAQDRAASQIYGDPALYPLSGQGQSGWTKAGLGAGLGAGAGYLTGLATGLPGAQYGLGALGGAAGTMVFSPAAAKKYMQAASLLEPVKKLGAYGAPATWNLLSREQE